MLGLISSITTHLRRLRDSLGEIADMAEGARDQLREQLGHGESPALEHTNGETTKARAKR